MSELVRDKRLWNEDGQAAVFCKAKDAWGCYGNMAGGYAFTDPATGLVWKNSEAWYQAQRFVGLPALQEEIRQTSNGWLAKKLAHEHVSESRQDWLEVNVDLMVDAVALKATNERFAAELLASGEKVIVELSMRDEFWGAKPIGNGVLRGANMLGQILVNRRAILAADRQPKARGMMGLLQAAMGP